MTTLPEEAVKAAITAYDKYYGDLAIYPSEEPTPEGAFHAALKGAFPFLSALEPSAARELALEEAARNLIAVRYDTYKARNGKLCSIEGDDGEKAWIVPFDAMADLESALSRPDHADAGKVEGDGWLPIESAPISNGSNRFLAYVRGHGQVVCYRTGIAIYSLSSGHAIYSATHWRPLPSAPASEGAE